MVASGGRWRHGRKGLLLVLCREPAEDGVRETSSYCDELILFDQPVAEVEFEMAVVEIT